MKKITIFMLLLFLMLSFASCKPKDNNGENEQKQSEQEEHEKQDGKKENTPVWPTSSVNSYCGTENIIPTFTGDYTSLKAYEDGGNLCIDFYEATENDYKKYSNILLDNGYTFKELPKYEKSFNGFKITVEVFYNEDHQELYLTINKQEVISGWPLSKITEAIGEEASSALPVFDGTFNYDFTSNEYSTYITIDGNNIGEVYNTYINDLKQKFILFEDFNEDTYKEYRFEYTNSALDTTSFDLIYDGDEGTVKISMSYETYEAPIPKLPETYHITYNLQNGKVLDIYKSGDNYVIVNKSTKYKVDYYKFNSSDKSYTYYYGEGNELSAIVLSETKKIIFREFITILKDAIYNEQSKIALNHETNPDLNETIISVPCEAHVWGGYIYLIDPNTNLVYKLISDSYVFREIIIFENNCEFPFELPR